MFHSSHCVDTPQEELFSLHLSKVMFMRKQTVQAAQLNDT